MVRRASGHAARALGDAPIEARRISGLPTRVTAPTPPQSPTRAVLFDLDDTLFDHHGSARAALAEVHRQQAPQSDFDAFERHHMHFLEELHLEVLAGRVGLDDARRERFRRVFRALGIELSDEQVNGVASAYRLGYVAARRSIEGAVELLRALSGQVRIGIVSNNLLDEQRDKLEFCGFAPFVDQLIVSDEFGMSKPDPALFRIALDRLGVTAADTVMVGDSWAADIVGAYRAGIPAIWYNPVRKRMPGEPSGIGEIHSLRPASGIASYILGHLARSKRRE